MRGAIAGIAVFEGWASDLAEAERMAGEGEFDFHPNHHFDAVGPMTGMTTRSQPVMMVENTAFGNKAYCAINEGLGKVMRFGGNDDEVIDRLRWLRDSFGPAFGGALRQLGVAAQRHRRARSDNGRRTYQRNVGCSSFPRALPGIGETIADKDELAAHWRLWVATIVLPEYRDGFGKAIMDPVSEIGRSSVVTAMSRNGTDFNPVSGTGDEWSPRRGDAGRSLFRPTADDAKLQAETQPSSKLSDWGLCNGGCPPLPVSALGPLGGSADNPRDVREITMTENPEWTIPLDYQGVPTGIDIARRRNRHCTDNQYRHAHREPGA